MISPPAILFASALTTATCADKPLVDLSVIALHHKPRVKSDYTLERLEELRAALSKPAKHRTLGFYAQKFGYTIDVNSVGVDGTCPQELSVVVQMKLFDRTIEIARDLAGSTDRACLYTASLKHYERHATAADEVLSLYARKVKARFRAVNLVARLDPSLPTGAVPQELKREVADTVDDVMQTYDQDSAAAQDSVDTAEEISKLEHACSAQL